MWKLNESNLGYSLTYSILTRNVAPMSSHCSCCVITWVMSKNVELCFRLSEMSVQPKNRIWVESPRAWHTSILHANVTKGKYSNCYFLTPNLQRKWWTYVDMLKKNAREFKFSFKRKFSNCFSTTAIINNNKKIGLSKHPNCLPMPYFSVLMSNIPVYITDRIFLKVYMYYFLNFFFICF